MMTKEEAIKILQRIDIYGYFNWVEGEYHEAFKMAIKALEQNPCEPPKYKLSRFEYDLLEALRYRIFSFGEVKPLVNMQDKGYFQDIDGDVKIGEILENCEVIDDD